MESLAAVATISVPKKKALFKSGPKKGRLRPGCRYAGKGIKCTPEVASRLGSKKIKGRKGKAKGKGKRRLNIVAKSPQAQANMNVFQALLQSRKEFKRARSCDMKRHYGRKIIQALQHMSSLPTKPTKTNPSADPRVRNSRYAKERDRVTRDAVQYCASVVHAPKTSAASWGGRGPASSREYYEHMARGPGGGRISGLRR